MNKDALRVRRVCIFHCSPALRSPVGLSPALDSSYFHQTNFIPLSTATDYENFTRLTFSTEDQITYTAPPLKKKAIK